MVFLLLCFLELCDPVGLKSLLSHKYSTYIFLVCSLTGFSECFRVWVTDLMYVGLSMGSECPTTQDFTVLILYNIFYRRYDRLLAYDGDLLEGVRTGGIIVQPGIL